MIRFAALCLSLLVSASALANSSVIVNREAVLSDVSVNPTNGGINPQFSAYQISGTVTLGSNPCSAQGLKADFVTKKVNGNNLVIARISGRSPANRMCTREYNPVFVTIETTVRGNSNLISRTYIKNVEEAGTEVALQSPCFEPTICTTEYQPYVCYAAELDRTFEGNNQCTARDQARRNACFRNAEVPSLSCEPKAPTEFFE